MVDPGPIHVRKGKMNMSEANGVTGELYDATNSTIKSTNQEVKERRVRQARVTFTG
jgi:hypothetical protein